MSRLNPYIILLTLTATFGGLLFGYDTAVISGAVGSLRAYFVDPQNLSAAAASSRLGFVVSSALIGCIIGGMIGGWVSTNIGRKKGLIIAGFLFLISALGAAAPEFPFAPIGHGGPGYMWNFVFYRILGGIGVGLASMLSPMYIAEIAPARIRGALVAWNQIAIVVGIVVIYFVNYSIAKSNDSETWLNTIGWRYMFLSGAIPAGIFLLLLFLVPETPRFLMLKNREPEAKAVLSKLVTAQECEQEISDIRASFAENHSGRLFSFGVPIVVIGVLLSVFQQVVGINAVLYYAPEIFKGMGMNVDASLLTTIMLGVVMMVFTIIAIFTVDKYGRKPLQIIGALLMAGSMITLGVDFIMQDTGIVGLICMIAFLAGFAVSWGPVTWVLLSEMFPNQIRGKAMAVAVAAQWIANYVVSWTFPILNENPYLVQHFNHGFAYLVYGGMGILAAIFVWKFVPETKGKTLEEMEQLWKKSLKH
jgi:SP family xylose:H+ symportor-like MFS transporter